MGQYQQMKNEEKDSFLPCKAFSAQRLHNFGLLCKVVCWTGSRKGVGAGMGIEEQSRRWGWGRERAEAVGARQRGGVGPRGRDSLGP